MIKNLNRKRFRPTPTLTPIKPVPVQNLKPNQLISKPKSVLDKPRQFLLAPDSLYFETNGKTIDSLTTTPAVKMSHEINEVLIPNKNENNRPLWAQNIDNKNLRELKTSKLVEKQYTSVFPILGGDLKDNNLTIKVHDIQIINKVIPNPIVIPTTYVSPKAIPESFKAIPDEWIKLCDQQKLYEIPVSHKTDGVVPVTAQKDPTNEIKTGVLNKLGETVINVAKTDLTNSFMSNALGYASSYIVPTLTSVLPIAAAVGGGILATKLISDYACRRVLSSCKHKNTSACIIGKTACGLIK
jgi:hypothetical protein